MDGASAVGDDLWEADIFINEHESGSGPKIALTKVNIVNNNDADLNKGSTVDILANAVLDLSDVVCVNGQYICLDLRKGPDANPDFTLGGTVRTCRPFSCKGEKERILLFHFCLFVGCFLFSCYCLLL